MVKIFVLNCFHSFYSFDQGNTTANTNANLAVIQITELEINQDLRTFCVIYVSFINHPPPLTYFW